MDAPAVPGAEVELLDAFRESDVDENEVITVGDGRPPPPTEVLDPFGELAETLAALGRNEARPVAAPCAPGESRADDGGLGSLYLNPPELRRLATRFLVECSSSLRPIAAPLPPSLGNESTGDPVREADRDPEAL